MEGVDAFLRSTFPTSTPAFHHAFDNILEGVGRDRLFQGPYLRVGLPFRPGSPSRDFFKRLETQYPPHLHQLLAWQRLRTGVARSTLVATGTGSGKTECFTYPILDHVLSTEGSGGIKAIVLYPMNALASDQARRFAAEIHRNPATAGKVRVGLYVGGHGSDSDTMSADSVITSRQAMRQSPPDILLTNYKMLDYLLVRPEDRGIWATNDPETLKYVVVDELHTFDGAQGSDLACLIRRVKARLKTPKHHLCCVGTSATLGNEGGLESLTRFAGDIFGEPFDAPEQAVIRENRISPAEHIGLERLEARWQEIPGPEHKDELQPAIFRELVGFLAAQAALWFPDAPALALTSMEDRVELAERLREHQFLRTLLTVFGEKSVTAELALLQAIKKRRPSWDDEHLRLITHSFISLCAFARDRISAQTTVPFLQIRTEVWMRELNRLVASVHPQPVIKFSGDLPANSVNQHLPVLHCRDCGVMGWGARQRTNSNKLLPELDKFYEAWFAYNPDPRLRMIFPAAGDGSESLIHEYVCGHCLTLFDSKDGTCPQCGTTASPPGDAEAAPAVRCFRVDSYQRTKTQGTTVAADLSCPFCDSSTGMTIVGSRSASLTSVALSQVFGSPFNDDKKAMAFSDSVQDASHRAGFFGARTYPIAVRTALQRVIDQQADPISLLDLSVKHPEHWRTAMNSDEFVGTFMPPHYEWNLDFERLVQEGVLPPKSRLADEVAERLAWDVYREFGLQARIGRTLEKSGSAACGLNPSTLAAAATDLMQAAREHAGFDKFSVESAQFLLLALCERLRRNGGIYHEALRSYVAGRGNEYLFNRREVLPSIPRVGRGRRPIFFATFAAKDSFERLIASGTTPTWTQLWLSKALNLADSDAVIHEAVKALVRAGIWLEIEIEGREGDKAWALNPSQLFVVGQSVDLECSACNHTLTVPDGSESLWCGSSCLRHKCSGVHQPAKTQGTTFFGNLYRRGDLTRMRSAEHTGLLEREEREALELAFTRKERRATDPKLLSCTPTLEMGVDIGDLSTVVMCSVPPEQANYAQRVGRGGRTDGNSLALTVATGTPHDQTYYEDPEKMIAGDVRMPAIFLNAPAVLERQLTAFCLDRWIEETPSATIPPTMDAIYARMSAEGDNSGAFPQAFLNFIDQNLATLVSGFVAMFVDGELQPGTIAHLKGFARGNSAVEGSLAYKLQTLLAEAHRNREDLYRQRNKVNQAIKRNQARTPRDEALDSEVEALRAERQSLSRLILQLNKKQTLNFLTDEGVIPNYAFPEEGVVLRSVILRKPSKDSGEDKLVKQEYEHMRPAEAAITELAPGNSFYVQGRKLTVDRVSVNQDNYETWHFCRTCSYMEPISKESTERSQCPQCGCNGWKDTSLRQSMLKMRQVFVTAWDKDVRSGDQKDTRELTTFNRQTSITFDAKDVTKSYSLVGEGVGFSFEFLSEINLREVNFGQERFDAQPIEIGGQTLRGVGFQVCSECGKIWRPGRSKANRKHDISCKHFGSEDDATFNQSLLLYRTLKSEAIRLMIPSLSMDDDRDAQSFIAAFHLGLRMKFGGHLHHLRLAIQYEPIQGGNIRTQHVHLYDAVPGGTGYLKDLTRDAESLLGVLDIALDHLKNCSCHREKERDGCYQCIRAYRFRHVDNQISRDTAIKQLTEILNHRSQIKEGPIGPEVLNPLLESELEKRFIGALGKEKGFKLTPEIVKGKPGYLLKVGKATWQLNLQQNLGDKDGVDVPCKPDVILEPVRPNIAQPLAVFLDGYAYHADGEIGNNRIADDFTKRNAVLRSGKLRVFSLTWDDLKGRDFEESTFLESGLKSISQLLSKPLADAPIWKSSTWNSWTLLTTYLRTQSEAGGQELPWHKVACFAAMTGATKAIFSSDSLRTACEQLVVGQIPDLKDNPTGDAMLLFQGAGPFRILAATPLAKIKDKSFEKTSAMLWFDDAQKQSAAEFRELWRQFLRGTNLLQFIPHYATVTKRMLDAGQTGASVDWVSEWQHGETPAAPTHATQAKLTSDQQEELEMLEPRIAQILVPLIAEGLVPYPEISYELLSESGTCLGAQVEVAWPVRKVAIALPEDSAEPFIQSGWSVLSSDGLNSEALRKALAQPA